MTNFNKLILLFTGLMLQVFLSNAQSYVRNNTTTIPGNGMEIFDTLTVSSLQTPLLNNNFGLDSVTLKLNYNYDQDLVISLIAPDGTVAQLANNLGGSGNNFNNTCFTMHVNNLVNASSAPFSGKMRPESWLGIVNNGQNGNGKWLKEMENGEYGEISQGMFIDQFDKVIESLQKLRL